MTIKAYEGTSSSKYRIKLFVLCACPHCGLFGKKRIIAPYGVFCTDCGLYVYTY